MDTTAFMHLDTAHDKDGWKIIGPGGGGCVHILTINPNRPDTILVSCDMTNGFITHDGGQAWREFNLKSRFFSFAFDPVNPDTIYAASSGLFRSDDNGQTWRLLFPNPECVTGEKRIGDEANHIFTSTDNWPGGAIIGITIDPIQPDHIHIAIKKQALRYMSSDFLSEEAAAAEAGTTIYFSDNRGKSWQEIATVPGGEIHCMLSGVRRRVSEATAAVSEARLVAFSGKGIFCIKDQGNVDKIPLPENIVTIRHASYGINPATGKTVFYISAVVRKPNGALCAEVWTSDDLAQTWQVAAAGLDPLLSDAQPDLPAFSQVSTCATDARVAYLVVERWADSVDGDRAVYYGIKKTNDQGLTWHWVVQMNDLIDPDNRNPGWPELDYGGKWNEVLIDSDHPITPKGRFAWDVVTSPVNPDVCYTTDYSTIFKTADGGKTWDQLVTRMYPDGAVSSTGIDILAVYGVFFDPFNANHIAVAHTDVGCFHSFDSARTWRHALAGVPRAWINTCYWMVFDPEVQGRAWSVWSGLHVVPRLLNFRPDFRNRYQGGVCKTDDACMTWKPSTAGIPDFSTPTHIVLEPASPPGNRTLYIAVYDRGVYKSADDGQTWTLKNNGIDIGNLYATRLALLPDGALYALIVESHMPGSEAPGALYKSTDGAETWQRLPLPEGVTDPNDITFDPADPNRLYLSCWPRTINMEEHHGGLYSSDDGGQTWRNIFDPGAHVYSVTVDPDAPSTLYMVTFDAAAYRSDDCGQTWSRLGGYNFDWGHRAIPDPHHPGMLYIATYGSSTWYGPAHGVPDAIEDIIT